MTAQIPRQPVGPGVVLLTALTWLVPTPGQAQDPLSREAFRNSRTWARTRFEAEQTDPREQARAQVDTARTLYQERLKGFERGTKWDTHDRVLSAYHRLRELELSLADPPASARALLEIRWGYNWTFWRGWLASFQAGRLAVADEREVRLLRLETELALQQAQGDPRSSSFGHSFRGLDSFREVARDRLVQDDWGQLQQLGSSRELARDRLALAQADRRQLQQQLLEAAQDVVRARMEGFLAGRKEDTLDHLLASLPRVVEAEQALTGKADPLPGLWKQWHTTWAVMQMAEASYRAGRLSLTDSLKAQLSHLDAQEMLLQKGAAAAKSLRLHLPLDPVLNHSLEARAAFAVTQADSHQIVAQRREMVRLGLAATLAGFLAGRKEDNVEAVLLWSVKKGLVDKDPQGDNAAFLAWADYLMEDACRRERLMDSWHSQGRAEKEFFLEAKSSLLGAQRLYRQALDRAGKR
jgi:hypothetical protein